MRADAFTFIVLFVVCTITWTILFFLYWVPMYKHRLLVVLADGKGLPFQGNEAGRRARVPLAIAYVLLHELVDAGLVTMSQQPGGAERGNRPRFLYAITFNGTLHIAKKAIGRITS